MGARDGLLWEGCCDQRQVPIVKGAKFTHSHVAQTIFRLQHLCVSCVAYCHLLLAQSCKAMAVVQLTEVHKGGPPWEVYRTT